jgi:hypothetical protein
MKGKGDPVTIRRLRIVVAGVVLVLLLTGQALVVSAAVVEAAGETVTAQQEETPYQPPDIDNVEVPEWLRPLSPIARLPLWGQAAVLSAGVAGLFFVVPMVFRWVWNLGPDDNQRGGPEP